MNVQPVRPSTVQGADSHNHRPSLSAENQLVPLRTRYYLTSHPELPGWRSPATLPTSAFHVTASRPTAFSTRIYPLQTATHMVLPPSLSVPSIRNRRPVTRGFTAVSPREVVLPVEPVPKEARIPSESAWVQRNLSTVPRLHMHLDRLDGGLPPLTAPPPSVVPALPLPKSLLAEVVESVSSSYPRTPLSPSGEASVIYARSQASEAVEDRLPTTVSPPMRLSMPDITGGREVEPAEITTVYFARQRVLEPLEWVNKETYQRVGVVRARTQIYSTKKLNEVLSEEEKALEALLDPGKSLQTIHEDKEVAEATLALSQELSAIPPDSSRLFTSPNSLPEDRSERLTLFRELFEGRPSTRSHTFTPSSSEAEQKSLFDVFMLELKRGAIKSREQALSFIKDELKDSMVSDMGVSRHSPSESTRPSYVLWAGENTGSESGSFFAFRRRGRNRSLGQKQGEEATEASPRLIRSSELKLRPRFADLSSVVLECAELGPARTVNEEFPLVEDPEAEQTLDIAAEEEEKAGTERDSKAQVEETKEEEKLPVQTASPKATEKRPTPQIAKKPDPVVAIPKPRAEPKSVPNVPEVPAPKARKGNTAKKPPASQPKSKSSSKTSRGNAPSKVENAIARSSSDTPAIPRPLPIISPFEVPPADDSSMPSADPPEAKLENILPRTFQQSLQPVEPLRRLSVQLTPPQAELSAPASETPPRLPTETDSSPKDKEELVQSVTWRHLFLREEAQVEKSVTAKEEIPHFKKVYDIRTADALEQFTVNMAVSLVTSLSLLFKHRTKGELESIKMRAVLDERRTLQKLTKLRGTTDRSVKIFRKAVAKTDKPEQQDSPAPMDQSIGLPITQSEPAIVIPEAPSSLPQPIAKSPALNPTSPANSFKPPRLDIPKSETKSAKSKRSRRSSKREESPDAKPDVDRNFVSSNIDFELRHIEMMRKLAAGLESSEGEGQGAQESNPEKEEKEESKEEVRGEDKPWKNCREEWEKGILADTPKNDVEELLQLMMKDKTLRDLLPFSTSITFSFAQTLDFASTLHDFTPLNPSLDPDLSLKQEMDLRAAFLEFCARSTKYDHLADQQSGVLFQAHKDSYLPTELRKEVREAVKKRRYKEKVAQERVKHRHVALRARVYTTFSGLPRSVRVHSTRPVSQNLLVDGFAHKVESELERKERVYMRMKKEENLRKLSSAQGRWSEASLQAGLKSLKSLFRPQTRG